MTNWKSMKLKRVIILLVGGLLLFSCQRDSKPKLEVFQTEKGWGYVVKKSDHVVIHQGIIPAVPGNQSFSTKEDAEKIGQLVLKKINDDQHPSLTVNELDSLHVFYFSPQ
ncbi:DUF4907 domain-containing protein [Gaoshiqia sediminis]|uniref:DUF4907 domain-containing protein n=1 Tax=Gaoshiqia sediminis TaxID=2986998 RepID=A0AA42C855_9BACT|nr:DUF4907 domain-containing protein [Gaoshiqia sediminis]MCW0482341.1 DUF4907 domain-containing protein [Gaoshiqia sediminis]